MKFKPIYLEYFTTFLVIFIFYITLIKFWPLSFIPLLIFFHQKNYILLYDKIEKLEKKLK